jgi:hypothetical protein
MKRILASVLVISLLVSCQRRNDDMAGDISQTATSGTWKVTLFTDSGNNETADFAGYNFEFQTGGIISATKNGTVKTGSWAADNSSNKLIINLGPKDNTNKPLGELTDDWKVISLTANEIKLTDDNAGSNEFVTFTKN